MSFTDEDLARLREMLYHKCEGEDNPPPMPFDGSPFDKMKALLARLEAAEKCAEAYAEEYEEYGEPCITTWRKSKGNDK